MSVLVSRLDEKEGILTGRSECPKCLVKLKWYDLVPLLSFFALGGKCRKCKEKISFIYPAMELSVAFSFASYLVINGFYLSLADIYSLMMIFILLILFFFDFTYYILPDKIIFPGIAISVLYSVFFEPNYFFERLLTGLGLAGFFAIMYVISHGEWIGFGDVKLALFVGLLTGFLLGMFSMLTAIWVGAFWGIGMMLMSRASMKTALPFGCFICSTTIISIIFHGYITLSLTKL